MKDKITPPPLPGTNRVHDSTGGVSRWVWAAAGCGGLTLIGAAVAVVLVAFYFSRHSEPVHKRVFSPPKTDTNYPALAIDKDGSIQESDWPQFLGEYRFRKTRNPDKPFFEKQLGTAVYRNDLGERLWMTLLPAPDKFVFNELANRFYERKAPAGGGSPRVVGLTVLFSDPYDPSTRFACRALESTAVLFTFDNFGNPPKNDAWIDKFTTSAVSEMAGPHFLRPDLLNSSANVTRTSPLPIGPKNFATMRWPEEGPLLQGFTLEQDSAPLPEPFTEFQGLGAVYRSEDRKKEIHVAFLPRKSPEPLEEHFTRVLAGVANEKNLVPTINHHSTTLLVGNKPHSFVIGLNFAGEEVLYSMTAFTNGILVTSLRSEAPSVPSPERDADTSLQFNLVVQIAHDWKNASPGGSTGLNRPSLNASDPATGQ